MLRLILLCAFSCSVHSINSINKHHKSIATTTTTTTNSKHLRNTATTKKDIDKKILRCRNFGDCDTVVPPTKVITKRPKPPHNALVAPWEHPPEREIRAETFVLERIREDSLYEPATFDRTYSLHRLNVAMRSTFCGGQAASPSDKGCKLYWQKCTTCAAAWYLAWWRAGEKQQLYTRAAVVDGRGKAIASQTPAVNVGNFHIDILVPYACRPEKLIDFADRVSELRDLTYLRIVLTNFHCDKDVQYMPSTDLKSLLVEFIGFKRKDAVVVVDAKDKKTKFSRAKALNMLHKECDENSMVVAMDIDMQFDTGFLDRIRE